MSDGVVTSAPKSRINILSIIAFIIALVALIVPLFKKSTTVAAGPASALTQIQQTKLLRVGFEGYPPYAVKDPSSGRMSGYSVDMVEYIAKEAGWKVEWVQTSPDTKVPDLEAGKFDLMVEPIFGTIQRAERVTFTRPYAYFGYAAGIVKKGDKRFSRITDLNDAKVKVAVRLGYTDQTYYWEQEMFDSCLHCRITDVFLPEVVADHVWPSLCAA